MHGGKSNVIFIFLLDKECASRSVHFMHKLTFDVISHLLIIFSSSG